MQRPVDNGEDVEAVVSSIRLSPIATVVTDPRRDDNPIVAANAAFCALTGYPIEDVLGRNCRFLAGDNRADAGADILRSAIAAARPAFAEIVNYRRDGTAYRNAVMIAPLFDAEGRLAYYLGSQMDVTDATGVPLLTRRQQAAAKVAQLSPRQREVLREMTLGFRNKQIAPRLGISEKTVKMHRASMLSNLGVTSSADAVRIAVEADL